jgi:hypothetical protein
MGSISSTIIDDIDDMRRRGLALLGFFYCDFRDDDKKKLRGLASSLLLQLCHQSKSYSTILSDLYSAHDDGSREPSDKALVECLKSILEQPGHAPVYIIIDGLDECPNTSGMPSRREVILTLIEELVNLDLTKLHICITSRPEVDIRTSLEPLTSTSTHISLHDESGQRKDIVDFVRAVVYSDKNMRRWRDEDKELVIETLSERADGM